MSQETRKIIRLNEVVKRTGLSRSSVYNLIAAGKFVPKIQITERTIGFEESAVDAWIHGKIKGGVK